jgi:hypothetical protein
MSTTEDARQEEMHATGWSRVFAFLSTWSLFIVAAIWTAFLAATL